MLSWICIVAASMLSVCEAAAAEDDPVLEAEAPRAIVKTVALEPATLAQKVEGFATILNPDPLIALDAEIRNADIAVEFSKRQYARFSTTPTLPKLTVEDAERKLSTDTTLISLLDHRLRHTWGEAAPFLKPDQRQALLAELAGGTRALVRMDFPVSMRDTPANVRITALGGGAEIPVDTLWVAPSGNQAMPGMSYFGLIPAGPGLRSGDRAKIVAETETRSGVVIPSASIIVSESQSWCYVEIGPQSFERKPVSLAFPVADGYLAETGFEPGTKVVVNGASTLLSRESEPAYGDDDDDGGDDDDKPAQAPAGASTETKSPTRAATALGASDDDDQDEKN